MRRGVNNAYDNTAGWIDILLVSRDASFRLITSRRQPSIESRNSKSFSFKSAIGQANWALFAKKEAISLICSGYARLTDSEPMFNS